MNSVPSDEPILNKTFQQLQTLGPLDRVLIADAWQHYGTHVELAPLTDSRREVFITALLEALRVRYELQQESDASDQTAREQHAQHLRFSDSAFMLESMGPYLSPVEIEYFRIIQQVRYDQMQFNISRTVYND
jgi:hypothetical protein